MILYYMNELILDWEANKLDTLVGAKLLDISCIRIATDLKQSRSKGRKLEETK